MLEIGRERIKEGRMLERFTARIELAANIAIVVTACLLAATVLKTYVLEQEIAPANNVSPIVEGSRLLNSNSKNSERTLILAISSTCHFCSESAPFYKKLIAEKGNARVIAVFPQSIQEGRAYLNQLGVPIDEVKQVALTDIGVQATPTLILIDGDGIVKKSWVGKLRHDEELIVLKSLQGM